MNYLKKLWVILTSLFLTFTLSFPVYAAQYTITNIVTPFGNDQSTVPEAWKVYYTQNATGQLYTTWYAKHYLNNEYVYCAQATQLAYINVSNYTEQEAASYAGSTKAMNAGYIAALGYGLDRSQEMDWATQIRIWQEVDGTVSNWQVPAPIQAKINTINQRLNVLKQDVSFDQEEITLTGYGQENGVTLNDENGVFQYYVENTNSGIHAQRNGNQLLIWAEQGDVEYATLTYSAFYKGGSTSPGSFFVSPTSQDVFKASYPLTKQISLNIHLQTGSIEVSKTDITKQKEIVGASMCVSDEQGNVVDSWISTNEAYLVKGLALNKPYTLTETLAPQGYAKASSITFTITDPDNIETIQMIDESAEVLKIDQTSQYVPNATLQVLDESGNVIDEWITRQFITTIPEGATSWNDETNYYELTPEEDDYLLMVSNSNGCHYYNVDENGYETKHRVLNLNANQTYILHEVSAQENYVLSEDVSFTVSGDTTVSMVDLKTDTVEISKVDATSAKEIEGAKLKVTDKDGNVIDEWISTKDVHIIEGLIVGESYTLTEELAPDGYDKAESITFTIEDNGEEVQKITMKDKKTIIGVPTATFNNHKTFIILSIGCLGIAILFIIRLRKSTGA